MINQLNGYQRWFLTGVPRDLEVDAADLKAFRDRNRVQLHRTLYFLLFMLLGINVLYWFTDAHLLAGPPHAVRIFARLRTSWVMIGVGLLVAQNLPGLSPYVTGLVAATLVCFSGGYHMALLGGPDTPWFHFLYPFLLVLPVAWGTPLERLGATSLLAVAILTGYFGLHPHHLANPLALVALGYFVYVLAISYLMGAYSDSNRIRLFMARLEVERSRDVLDKRVVTQSIILSGLHARLDTLREAERQGLARDLHDDLGQLLTAQRLVLEATRQRYRQNGSSIEANLATLGSLLDRFSVHFRSQLHSLRPPVGEGRDLHEAIRGLVERWSEQAAISCNLDMPAEIPGLDVERAGVVYRFVQEALTNVARHAGASEVEVSIEAAGGRLRARVSDNGVGMGTPSGSSHMGLMGIRERVQMVQGKLEIDSAPGEGTTLRIDFPTVGMAPGSYAPPVEEDRL